jgi:prepilin-type N-terminal cleavage/methylation domain-containing protein
MSRPGLASKSTRRGFTLIELLIVVVIIGILASVALPSFIAAQDRARNVKAVSMIAVVRQALENYGADKNGNFPSNPNFVTAAGLVETLQGPGPFTVFAPTNAAFAALPAGILDKLLLPENKEVLAQILTYHVVSGQVMAADVVAGDVPSVQGEPITITTDGGVKVNNANVTATDVAASNGVIHVIDAVILPPSLDISTL